MRPGVTAGVEELQDGAVEEDGRVLSNALERLDNADFPDNA